MNNHVQFRHIDASEDQWGLVAAAIKDFTVDDSVFHDNFDLGCGTGQHGIYLTSHDPMDPSKDVFVFRNLLYRNCYNGLQVNGKFSNVVVEQNIAYSNEVGGFAFLEGVHDSVMRSNLSFNNANTPMNFFDDAGFCNIYDATSSCPYDQNNNLIVGNTFYSTGKSPKTGDDTSGQPSIGVNNAIGVSSIVSNKPTYVSGGSGGTTGTQAVTLTNNCRIPPTGTISVSSGHPTGGVTIDNSDSGPGTGCTAVPTQGTVDTVTGTITFTGGQLSNASADLGNNRFLNNIFVNYSQAAGGNGYPNFRYDETTYASTTTFQNNVFYNLQPTAGSFTNIIQTVSGGVTTYYTCAQAVSGSGSTFGSFTNCTNADPQFAAASPSYWNSIASFNFALAAGSPALSAGQVLPGINWDLTGRQVSSSPSLGALQPASSVGATSVSGSVTFSGGVTIH